MQSSTSLRVSTEVHQRLQHLKIHANESFDDVIRRLIDIAVDDEPLSDATIRAIEESLQDLKAGRVYTSEQVRDELGLKKR
jgi:predicted transcriptional regulator